MSDETLEALRAHLLELERRNLRQSTRYQRLRVIERLQRQFPGRCLLELTGDEIAAALDARDIDPGGRATEISHLVQFYEWASVHMGVPSPMVRVARPKVPKRLPRPMPDDDVARALRSAEGRVLRALLLATYAGLRAYEIALARYDHAVLNAAVPVMVVPESKGGGMSTVPLHDDLVSMLREGPSSGWVFPRLDGRAGPASAHNVSHAANRYLHSLGISHTLHTLRHWYGTHLYEASGNDLRTTQEGMRHASISSTVLYTWVSPGKVADAVAGLPRATHPRLRSVN